MSTRTDWSSICIACSKAFRGSLELHMAKMIRMFFLRCDNTVTIDLCPLIMADMASDSDISGCGWIPNLIVSWRCLGKNSSKSRPAGWSRVSGIISIGASDGDGGDLVSGYIMAAFCWGCGWTPFVLTVGVVFGLQLSLTTGRTIDTVSDGRGWTRFVILWLGGMAFEELLLFLFAIILWFDKWLSPVADVDFTKLLGEGLTPFKGCNWWAIDGRGSLGDGLRCSVGTSIGWGGIYPNSANERLLLANDCDERLIGENCEPNAEELSARFGSLSFRCNKSVEIFC